MAALVTGSIVTVFAIRLDKSLRYRLAGITDMEMKSAHTWKQIILNKNCVNATYVCYNLVGL
jgi:hypothetical protein